jgi:hypothetical protein
MLEEISVRQQKLGLSTRKFAEQLDVSPTLLQTRRYTLPLSDTKSPGVSNHQ